MNKARFEAFSDGVFAFAITLLVLGFVLPTFKPPEYPTEANLLHALLKLWPNLVAYLLSFAVIGIMWQNHHAFYRMVDRIDRTTVFLNLALLAVTVFIPFATSVLGTYPTMKSSTFLYGLTLTLSATFFNLIPLHIVRSHALSTSVDAATIQQTFVAYRVGWVTYALATLLSLLWPVVSFALYILIAAFIWCRADLTATCRNASASRTADLSLCDAKAYAGGTRPPMRAALKTVMVSERLFERKSRAPRPAEN
jgi:uncharacterized membrane protein